MNANANVSDKKDMLAFAFYIYATLADTSL